MRHTKNRKIFQHRHFRGRNLCPIYNIEKLFGKKTGTSLENTIIYGILDYHLIR